MYGRQSVAPSARWLRLELVNICIEERANQGLYACDERVRQG